MSETPVTAQATATTREPYEPQVLALVCERSVPIDELINADQRPAVSADLARSTAMAVP